MCTTLIVTRGASADGSAFVAHSDDDDLYDQRLIQVPPQDHPEGAQRPVFGLCSRYPRLVTDERGPGYDTAGYPRTVPIGHIPQVQHTYGYFDGNYGVMNEHNLMIGECTNAATFQPPYVTAEQAVHTGRHMRIMHSEELSRIALERCTRAREAVALIGRLIDEYGLYDSGETLLVADADEAWVFEMCALPHEEYHSAWVAQRVPDGHVFVAANEFRIRDIPLSGGTADILVSPMLVAGVTALGWWDPKSGSLDWLRAVSPGEYCHPYYSLRRVWRVLDRVNPDLCLSPWVDDGYTTAYPFSVAPSRPLALTDVVALYRDHYEGTPFDLTRGPAAGPFGDPTRVYDPDADAASSGGAWERPISVFSQGYTYVNQARPGVPASTAGLVWFGPDVSYTTCFAPFPVRAPLPWSYQSGSPQVFDRAAAWWAFDFVANWARLNFQRMTTVDIRPRQERYEREQLATVARWDEACRGMTAADARAYLAKACEENATELLRRWWELADTLVAKYSSGFVNPTDRADARTIGYPAPWLLAVGYPDGPTTYAMTAPATG
ncbi:MAG: dipeptidase [Dactylosporangium sp.]|nr:C69 family dipeptidase [Dactylosporangium sp.]NNJ59508.1 dipeptidase [Dactylosporangium sp.]